MGVQLRPSMTAAWLGGAGRVFEGFRRPQRGPIPSTRQPLTADWEPPSPGDRLAFTYAGSLLEVALQLEGVRDGSLRLEGQPTSLLSLARQLTDELAPLAQAAGRRLLHPPGRAETIAWRTDPVLLRLVMRHLMLRALVGEVAPGSVRTDVALSGREARLCVLSRAGAQPVARQRALDGVSELSAIQRLLTPIGGALEIEPRRAGYLPLNVVLRATGPQAHGAACRVEAA